MREKNNNHNGERRGEIGEQMNWTISLRGLERKVKRSVKQKGCRDGGPETEREAGGNKGRLNREKMRNCGVCTILLANSYATLCRNNLYTSLLHLETTGEITDNMQFAF